MWNTVRVANIDSMFYDALAFNGDLGGWNTASVTTMRFVFQSSPLTLPEYVGAGIGAWNTASITTFQSIFDRAQVHG